MIRSRSSPAARFVNVTARIRHGATCLTPTRYAIRCASTRVLPEPAPARISTGPSVVVTARACSGFSRPRISLPAASRRSRPGASPGRLAAGLRGSGARQAGSGGRGRASARRPRGSSADASGAVLVELRELRSSGSGGASTARPRRGGRGVDACRIGPAPLRRRLIVGPALPPGMLRGPAYPTSTSPAGGPLNPRTSSTSLRRSEHVDRELARPQPRRQRSRRPPSTTIVVTCARLRPHLGSRRTVRRIEQPPSGAVVAAAPIDELSGRLRTLGPRFVKPASSSD